MNTQIQGDHRSDSGLADLLHAIRTEHEERWQVNADYYRAAMRDISLIRLVIVGIFVLEVAECFV